MKPSAFVSGLMIGLCLAVPIHASAQGTEACRAFASTVAPRQAEIDDLQAQRDAAAAGVEAQGHAWEEAEIHRLASAGHARTADAARTAYDDAKKGLARHEMALQATVRAFNDDTEQYNRMCVPEE